MHTHATSFHFWCHLSTAFTLCPLIWHFIRPNHLYIMAFLFKITNTKRIRRSSTIRFVDDCVVANCVRSFQAILWFIPTETNLYIIHRLSTNTRISNSSFQLNREFDFKVKDRDTFRSIWKCDTRSVRKEKRDPKHADFLCFQNKSIWIITAISVNDMNFFLDWPKASRTHRKSI